MRLFLSCNVVTRSAGNYSRDFTGHTEVFFLLVFLFSENTLREKKKVIMPS